MKRTFTVNLNNTVYHIDDDAYDLLRKYLAEVESRLSSDEQKEVMGDIEARVSELFAERLQRGKNVINIKDVEEIIHILGKPNQFAEDEGTEQEAYDSDHSSSKRKGKRKYYRDHDNAVLGGVASGLAALLGWDIVLVRILLVIIVFLGYGTIIPIYLLVWLIAPSAKTIAQKLEMQGEDVTAERIKEEINNLKNYMESDKFKESATGVGNRLGEVFRILFKIVVGFIGIVMGFVGLILLGVLLLVLSFAIFEPSMFSGFIPDLGLLTPARAILMIIALLLIVGIPILMIISWAVKSNTGKRAKSRTSVWMLSILWILSIFMFAGLGARTVFTLNRGDFDNLDLYWSDEDGMPVDEMRQFERFQGIEVNGNIKLELVDDSVQTVKVSAQPNVLSQITTVVENGVLKISTQRFNFNRHVTVYVSASQLQTLSVNGASKITSNGKVTTDQLHVKITGASKVDLDVAVGQTLEVEMSGASKADIDGHAYRLKVDVSGASKLDVEELLVRNAVINGSGASKIEANVTDSLEVEVSGASQFKAKNKPIYLKQKSTAGSSIRIN